MVWLAAIITIAATARLGLWQLDRADQKLALQARQVQRAAAPVLDGPALVALRASPEAIAEQLERRIRIKGRWMPQHTVFLDNRQMDGRVGFYVLTPLLLPSGDAVVVQRGWTPRNFEQRDAVPDVPTPPDSLWIQGQVAPAPGRLYDLGQADGGRIRQNLDLPAFSREIGLPVRPVTIRQTEPSGPDTPLSESGPTPDSAGAKALGPPGEASGDGLSRRWPAPALGVGKHHGYAFQWFALCALTAGLTLWFQIIRPRRARTTPTHGHP